MLDLTRGIEKPQRMVYVDPPSGPEVPLVTQCDRTRPGSTDD